MIVNFHNRISVILNVCVVISLITSIIVVRIIFILRKKKRLHQVIIDSLVLAYVSCSCSRFTPFHQRIQSAHTN